MAMTRAIYKDIYKSQASTRGNWFKDGEGLLVLVEVLAKSDGKDGETLIPVFKVLESRSKGDTDAHGKVVEPNAVGSTVSYPQKLRKFKSALGNIKGLVCALLGVSEDSFSEKDFEDTMEGLVGPGQDARGMLVRYTTYQQATEAQQRAGRGEKNTYPSFHAVADGNSEAEVKARRAELDKTNPVTPR